MPKRPRSKWKKTTMNIGLPQEVKNAIKRAADKDYAPDASAWVVATLVRALKRRGEL